MEKTMSATKKTPAGKPVEKVEAAVKVGADVAAKGYEQAVAMTKEQVEAAVAAGSEVFKGYEDVAAYNKENVDAVIKSGAIFTKGVQEINSLMFGLAKAALDENVALTKAMFGCSSVVEAVDLQSKLAKTNYDKALNDSRKLSDLSLKLAEESIQPIAERVNVAVEKISKPLAA